MKIRLNVPGTVITCGESKLVGKIVHRYNDGDIDFQPEGAAAKSCFFSTKEWVVTYPAPKLPTEIGTVIESGGVRFMRDDSGSSLSWSSSKQVECVFWHEDETVLSHTEKHGGFTILLQGTPTGGKG